MGASGVGCFSLHFVSGIEEYQQVGPDLFGFVRGRAREGRPRGTAATDGAQGDAGRSPEAVCSMSPA
jgi:hypothetical protein